MIGRRVRRLAAVLLCAAPVFCAAQTWPQKSIRLIVPFAPGGGTDYIARLAGKYLSLRLGQPVVVDNRGGANGAIGLQTLMQADPDGYTLCASSDTPLTVNPSLYPKLPYQPLRDFATVAMMVRFPGLLAVNPSVPARNVKELIALAKAKPGTLAYGSGGVGNFSHLAGELFSIAAGVKLVHVPFKGVGPANVALLAGEVQLMFNNIQTTIEHVRAGRLIALAVNEPQRVPMLPDVPAVAETVPGFEMTPWVGIIAPTKTPPKILARLSEETLAFVRDPEVTKLLTDQMVGPYPLDAPKFAEVIRKDLAKWAKVIKTAGIKVE